MLLRRLAIPRGPLAGTILGDNHRAETRRRRRCLPAPCRRMPPSECIGRRNVSTLSGRPRCKGIINEFTPTEMPIRAGRAEITPDDPLAEPHNYVLLNGIRDSRRPTNLKD